MYACPLTHTLANPAHCRTFKFLLIQELILIYIPWDLVESITCSNTFFLLAVGSDFFFSICRRSLHIPGINPLYFFFDFIFKLYIIVLVLPNIKMNPPQVYMCSPSWTLLPPPSPNHPSGSSQCSSPKHPVSCIEPGLACFILFCLSWATGQAWKRSFDWLLREPCHWVETRSAMD